MNFFIEHYVKLGFFKIVILQTGFRYKIQDKYKEKSKSSKCNRVYHLSRRLIKKYDWVFVCDADEILFLNKKYENINDYVSQCWLF